MLTNATGPQIQNAIMEFREDHKSEVPAELWDRFKVISTMPIEIERVVKTGEYIYEHRAVMPPAAIDLCLSLMAYLAEGNSWGYGDAGTGRGMAIIRALRRDLGEAHPVDGTDWPDPANDPAVKPDYDPSKPPVATAPPIAPPVS